MSYEMVAILGYQEVFGEKGDLTAASLINEIPSASIIEVIANWNSQIHITTSEWSVQERLLKDISRNFRDEIKHRIMSALMNRKGRPVVIFTTVTSCQFFCTIFSHYNSAPHRNVTAVDLENIFRAYLLLSDFWSIKTQKVFKKDSLPPSGNYEEIWKITIPSWVPYQIEIERRDFALEFIKAHDFFEFLRQDKEFATIVDAFLKRCSVQTWQGYITNVFKIYGLIHMKGSNTIPSMFNSKDDETLKVWLISLSIDPTTVTDFDDYKEIREKPLFRFSENDFIVLNINFLLDKLFRGVLFELGHLSETNEAFKNFENYKSIISYNFAENRLFNGIMNEVNKSFPIRYSGNELHSRGAEIEPDYYARRYQELFIFEFKDIVIKRDVKHSYDFDVIEKEVLKKIVKGDRDQNKGITQLAASIKAMKPDGYGFDHFEAKRIRAYPIIVVTDAFFNAPAMNTWLNKLFWQQIGDYQVLCHLNDLIIIDLDTLIWHKSLFSTNQLNLANECQSYYRHKNTIYNKLDSFARYLSDRVDKLDLKANVDTEFSEKVRALGLP